MVVFIYGGFQMKANVSLIVLLSLILSACSGGSGGGNEQEVKTPSVTPSPGPIVIPEPIEADDFFVVTKLQSEVSLDNGISKVVELTLDELKLDQSRVIYFEWLSESDEKLNEVRIIPAKGIIHPQALKADYQFEFISTEPGTYSLKLQLMSENKSLISKVTTVEVE